MNELVSGFFAGFTPRQQKKCYNAIMLLYDISTIMLLCYNILLLCYYVCYNVLYYYELYYDIILDYIHYYCAVILAIYC